jgi:outer membrane cobalamin receptor
VEAEAPAAITVLDKTSVEQQPGWNIDDRLRSVPGFSLFRRTSSLVANPTTQGESLRGLGSSGASRTLVLWDSIPVNDPFGGWVYWTRISPEELDRVEVERGASTSVFGDRAMSGTIALFSHPPERHRLTAGYEGGNQNTHSITAGFSQLWSKWAASFHSRALTTDGYYIVPQRVRGSVDQRANVRFVTGDTRLDYLGADDRFFLKFDVLVEDRGNGTLLTHNSTSLGEIAGQYSHQWAKDTLSIEGFHTREQFHSSFSAVTNNRNTERLTFLQRVPSQAVGSAGLWRHSGRNWNVLGGADVQRVEGVSTDRLVPTGQRVGGGSQLQHGVFGQLDVTAGIAKLFVGARHQFTGTNDTFFSPNAGFVVGRGVLRARGSVYRAFRAPTLNELYREFRVGNSITQANAGLQPEKVFGAEAGFDVVGETARLSATVFRHSLENLITNVTVSQVAGTITRQRRNAAEALARGFDVDARKSFGPMRVELGYLFADSRFANGARIPQVPKHQGTGQITYVRGGTLISGGVRSYGLQFEDDINQFVLPGFATVQLSARQKLIGSLSAIAAVENALDREFQVGASPTPLIGAPRLWRLGLRWDGVIR